MFFPAVAQLALRGIVLRDPAMCIPHAAMIARLAASGAFDTLGAGFKVGRTDTAIGRDFPWLFGFAIFGISRTQPRQAGAETW